MAHVIIIGHIGSDAGYWEIVNGKLIHVPGWNPEALAELSNAAKLISQATTLKSPDLANRLASAVSEFVLKEVGANVKGREGNTISVIGT